MKVIFFNNKFEKSNKELDLELIESSKSISDLIFQYVRIYLSNKRQGTSKVKTRAEVSGGGKKPWRQKGTGRARSGSSRSPLWVGGGVSHGPKPKSWALDFNKKMKRKAFKYVVGQAVKNEKLLVVDFPVFEKPSTKTALAHIGKVNISQKKVLLLTSSEKELIKSFNNIPFVKTEDFMTVNVFDILNADNIILTANSFDKLKTRI